MDFSPKVLSYDDIRDEAEQFLDEYHKDRDLPVPIELIVEFDLGMDIVPIPGLQADTRVDAFLASDLSQVFIDEDVVQWSPNRYRFSLAHEAGHWWLHDGLYEDSDIASVRDWKAAYAELGEDYKWFEFQANSFAGLVLVPSEVLKARFERLVGEAGDKGMKRSALFRHPARQRLIEALADNFKVSEQVMEIRLEKDGLIPRPDEELKEMR